MSIAEDYFDFLDLPDDEPSDEIICRYCDQGYLTWGETIDGWRLFDEHGRQHRCRDVEVTADNFPAV
jgi:hypothetical protein